MMHLVCEKFLVFPIRSLIKKSEAFFESPVLAWLIIGFAIVVRCVQYLANRSFWLDESFLALNIINRTFFQLLQPLDYAQGAPIGFLMIEKAIVQVLGNCEYAFRLFPLLCGIASVILFYKTVKIILTPKAVIIGSAIFAFSGPLMYYSSEAKQYSSDVAMTLLLYFFTIQYVIQNGLTTRSSVLFGIIGSVTIWFSHPTIFILAGIGIVLVLRSLMGKEWKKLRYLSIACAFIMLNFVVIYFVSLRPLAKIDVLRDYWANSFMPLAPFSLHEVRWFIDVFFAIFEYPAGLAFAGMGSLCFLVGCRSFLRDHKEKFYMFILPMFFTLLASGFEKYPFNGRLLLFIVPSLLIFIAQGADEVIEILRCRDAMVALAFGMLLLLHPGLFAGYYLIKPYMREEITPVLSYVRDHHQPGDVLYLYGYTLYAFKYYQERYGFVDEDYIVGHGLGQWKNHLDDLKKISGKKRVWILFSHLSNPDSRKEEDVVLSQLNSMGTRLAALQHVRAAVYLYDLTPPMPPLGILNPTSAP